MRRLEPDWLQEPAVARLLAALAAGGIEARFVGGCVRDARLGLAIGDIDLATPARPEAVVAALAAARIKAVPTGLAHGTVTAVVPLRSFEITTLRRDIETDGRRAVVAFDAGWEEDARRRDFTINALYLAPDGRLFDPVGGDADLAARRVRFVGDPATRITEDVLRVLRYYRFEARFGSGEGDAQARAACRAATGSLSALSAERVAKELLRLIGGAEPVRALRMMRDDGVLPAILPEATRLDRLDELLQFDPHPSPPPPAGEGDGSQRLGDAPSTAGGGGSGWGLTTVEPLLRLAALVDVDRAGAIDIGRRLRLSSVGQRRLADLAPPWPLDPAASAKDLRLALYRLGRERYGELALLSAADGRFGPPRLRDMLDLAETWEIPTFPLSGDDVTALGIPPGPTVGRLLGAVRRWWEAGDFVTGRRACLARLKEVAETDQ